MEAAPEATWQRRSAASSFWEEQSLSSIEHPTTLYRQTEFSELRLTILKFIETFLSGWILSKTKKTLQYIFLKNTHQQHDTEATFKDFKAYLFSALTDSTMKYRKWDVITASETYLKPGEMVAQLLDFSQMQYGSRDDRQLLHSRQKPDRRSDNREPSSSFNWAWTHCRNKLLEKDWRKNIKNTLNWQWNWCDFIRCVEKVPSFNKYLYSWKQTMHYCD